MLLGLVYVANRSPWLARRQPADVSTEPNPVVPFLAPFVVLIVTGMATVAFADEIDRFYGMRLITVGAAIWACRRTYARWDWRVSPQAILLGTLAWVLWTGLEVSRDNSLRATGLQQAIQNMPAWAAAAWLALRVAGSCIAVPIAEELAFRGYLLRRLIAAWQKGDGETVPDFDHVSGRAFTWFSFLVSSLLFGAMHRSVLAGTAAGMVYAVALRRRGRLSDAIAAHATTNLMIAVQVLAAGEWRLWT